MINSVSLLHRLLVWNHAHTLTPCIYLSTSVLNKGFYSGTQVAVGRESLHSNPSLIFSMTPRDIALLGWSGSVWPAGWYMSAFRARAGESGGLRWRAARGRRCCALRMLQGARSTAELPEAGECLKNNNSKKLRPNQRFTTVLYRYV